VAASAALDVATLNDGAAVAVASRKRLRVNGQVGVHVGAFEQSKPPQASVHFFDISPRATNRCVVLGRRDGISHASMHMSWEQTTPPGARPCRCPCTSNIRHTWDPRGKGICGRRKMQQNVAHIDKNTRAANDCWRRSVRTSFLAWMVATAARRAR
jgi:hypothetical protein